MVYRKLAAGLVLLCSVCTLCVQVLAGTWSNLVMIEVHTETEEHMKKARIVAEKFEAEEVSELRLADFGEYLVEKVHAQRFMKELTREGMKCVQRERSFQDVLDAETKDNELSELSELSGRQRRQARRSSVPKSPDKYFVTSVETGKWLRKLARSYPELTKLHHIGTSHEGRDMFVMQVGPTLNRYRIFVESGIHAREWLAPATNAFMLHKLLEESQTKDDVKLMLQRYSIYFLINANPDGYDYTFKKESIAHSCKQSRVPARLWRKTRKPYGRNHGADPNRNFNSDFYGRGSQPRSCSFQYRGAAPFSENCVRNLAKFMENSQNEDGVPWLMTWSVHAAGKMFLLPGGTNAMLVKDSEELAEQLQVANATVQSIIQNGGETQSVYDKSGWRVGSVKSLLGYYAPGAAHDWYRIGLGVRFPYGIELMSGQYGRFIPSRRQIRPSGSHMYAGLLAAIKEMNSLGY